MLLGKYCQVLYPEGINCPLMELWVSSLGMAPTHHFPWVLDSVWGRPLFLYPSSWPHVLRALENLLFTFLNSLPSCFLTGKSWGPRVLPTCSTISICFRPGWEHFCQFGSSKHMGFLCIWFQVPPYANKQSTIFSQDMLPLTLWKPQAPVNPHS